METIKEMRAILINNKCVYKAANKNLNLEISGNIKAIKDIDSQIKELNGKEKELKKNAKANPDISL